MQPDGFLDYVITAMGTLILAIGKGFHGRLKDIEDKQAGLHEVYVKRDDLEKSLDRVFNTLERIETKLDGKMDK